MTIDLAALRRQAEACGNPMAMHPSVVLELLDELDESNSVRAGYCTLATDMARASKDLRAKLEAYAALLTEGRNVFAADVSGPGRDWIRRLDAAFGGIAVTDSERRELQEERMRSVSIVLTGLAGGLCLAGFSVAVGADLWHSMLLVLGVLLIGISLKIGGRAP